MDESDDLCLDDLPLVPASPYQTPFQPQEYRTVPDTLRRVVSYGSPSARVPHVGPSSFRVYNPDGTIFFYEQRLEATLGVGTTDVHDPQVPVRYAWYLSAITGPNVNTVYILYDHFESETRDRYGPLVKYTAELRPSSMVYGAGRKVAFTYASEKPDLFPKSFTYGVPRHQSTPLKTIETYVEGVLVKKYVLTTIRQGRTKLLESLQVCAPDGSVERCMPKTTFEYGSSGRDFAAPEPTFAELPYLIPNKGTGGIIWDPKDWNALAPVVLDWNGDGFDDLIYRGEGGQYPDGSDSTLLISQGPVTPQRNVFAQVRLEPPFKLHNQEVFVVDLNEDGRDDMVALYDDPNALTRRLAYTLIATDGPDPFVRRKIEEDVDQAYLVDLDRDGRKDYVTCGGGTGGWAWSRNLGTRTFPTKQPLSRLHIPCKAVPIDFDGNGTEELVNFSVYDDYFPGGGHERRQLIEVVKFVDGVESVRALPALPEGPRLYLDANGDGRTDVVVFAELYRDDAQVSLYLNTGAAFTLQTSLFVNKTTLTQQQFGYGFAADRDGDGTDELYFPKWSDGTIAGEWIRHEPLSRKLGGGDEWRTTSTALRYQNALSAWQCHSIRDCHEWFHGYGIPTLADIDGDGDRDLLMRTYSTDRGINQPTLDIYESESAQRGLLGKITDGLRRTTELEYDNGVSDPTYVPGSPQTCTYPALCVHRLPHRVVRTYTTSGEGGPFMDPQYPSHYPIGSTRRFEYRDGRVDRLGRGWLGMVRRTDRETSYQGGVEVGALTSYFDLSYDDNWKAYLNLHIPVLEVATTSVLSGTHAATPFTVTNLEHQRIYSPTVIARAPSFMVRPELTADINSENGAPVSAITSTYAYDEFGNAQFINENHLSGLRRSTIIAYSDFAGFSAADQAAISQVYPDLQDPNLATHHDRAMWSLPLAVLTTATQDGSENRRLTVSRYSPFGYPVENARFMYQRATGQWEHAETTKTVFDSFGNGHFFERSAPGETTRTTSITFDRQGVFPAAIENGEHAAKGFAPTLVWYDPRFGQKTLEISPDGVLSYLGSDPFGRPKLTGGDGQPTRTWTYTGTNDVGTLRAQITGVGTPTQTIDYNAFGQPVRVVTEDYTGRARSTEYGYNIKGQLVSESVSHLVGAPVRGVRRFQRDKVGRIISASYPVEALDGSVTESVWSVEHGSSATVAAGNRGWFDQNGGEYFAIVTRPDQTQIVAISTASGQVRTSVAPDGRVSTFRYDPFGGLSQRDSAGESWTAQYDSAGRVTRTQDPDRGVEEFVWNGFGELREVRRPGANVMLSYDGLGRLRERIAPEGITNWFWDGDGSEVKQAGHLAAVTSPGFSALFHYEQPGAQLSSKTVTVGQDPFTTDFVYAANGQLDLVTYPDAGQGRVSTRYVRNSLGRITAVNDVTGSTPRTLWSVEDVGAFGEESSVRHGNGLVTSRILRSATGQLSRTQVTRGTETLFGEEYDYDSLTRLHGRRPIGGAWETFSYDANSRIQDVSNAGSLVRHFEYDQNGNLRTSPAGYGLTYLDARPHAVSDSTRGDSYRYDARGNQQLRTGPSIAETRQRIEYNSFDLPSAIYQGAGEILAASYIYDADQRRVRETTPTQQITTLDGLFRVEATSAGAARRGFAVVPTPDGSRIEMDANASSPVARYQHLDRLGSTRLLSGAQGQSLGSASYGVFGDPAVTWGTTTRGATSFTGHEYDAAVGLTDMKGRIYDPALARFLSPDPVVQEPLSPQAWNRYSYVWNNPLNFIDPTGFQSVDVPLPPPPQITFGDECFIYAAPTKTPTPTAVGPGERVTTVINSPSVVTSDSVGESGQGPRRGAPQAPSVATPMGTLSATPASLNNTQAPASTLPPITTMAQMAQVLNTKTKGIDVSLLYTPGAFDHATAAIDPVQGFSQAYQMLMDEFAPPWARFFSTVAMAGTMMSLIPKPTAATQRLLAAEASSVGAGAAAARGALGRLTAIGSNTWKSSGGLIYGADKVFGNRVQHVLAHTVADASKPAHSVFNVARDKVLGLVDEAWSMRGTALPNDPGAFVVAMGRAVGTAGETALRVVVRPGTAEIITAYPVFP